MFALAEFIMRGRAQAAVVALVGSLLPLISPAAVALVTLRRGAQDGALVLAWALLPALVGLFVANMDALMTWATIAGTFVVYAAALLLRYWPSWPRMLMGLVAVSSATVLGLLFLAPEVVQVFVSALNDMLVEVQKAAKSEVSMQATTALVSGLLTCGIVLHGVAAIALGRWWQARLYNPGAFQTEFHSLRLGRVQAFVCLAATLYCSLLVDDLLAWSLLFSLPLLVAGIALAHSLIATRKLGGQWLLLLYVTLMIFAYASTLLIALAFIDAWINFRSRVKAKPEP
jgi:hypothetical protein